MPAFYGEGVDSALDAKIDLYVSYNVQPMAELAVGFLTRGLTSDLPRGIILFRPVQVYPLTLIAFRGVWCVERLLCPSL